jgi:hypothetical protein
MSFIDLRGVERGALPRLPSDDEIACFNPLMLLYQVEAPRLIAYHDKASKRRAACTPSSSPTAVDSAAAAN